MLTSLLSLEKGKYQEALAQKSVAFVDRLWGTILLQGCIPLARISILVTSDFIALLTSMSLGYFIWARLVMNQPLSMYQDLSPIFLLFPLGFAKAGLYPGFGIVAV